MITKKYIPDSHLGHWIIYINGEEFCEVPDSELHETLADLRHEFAS